MAEVEREGGCLCGAVRYRVRGEPIGITLCHCTDCQKQSGSAFSMSMVLRREQLSIEAGDVATYHCLADSGADKHAYFCRNCGGRIYNTLSSMPETLNLKPGTLDDTSWLSPQLQVWTKSKQPWLTMGGLHSFEENPRLSKG